MKAKEFIPASKPRNPVVRQQQISGAGAHRDKKKEQKQGYEKHKGKSVSETALRDKEDLMAKRKALQDLQMDPIAAQDKQIKQAIMQRKADLEKEAKSKGMAESDKEIARTHKGGIVTKTAKGIKHTKTDYDDEGMGWKGKDKTDFDKSPYKKFPILDKDIDERIRDPEDWDEGNKEPPNNMAVYINGKLWKVFRGNGYYADDEREMNQYYKLQDWARRKSQATGKRWEVSRTGAPATESIKEDTDIPFDQCPHCSGPIFHESLMNEKQDACYHKVRSRYKVWPSAYASGALVQCRKKGAKNWGNKGKK